VFANNNLNVNAVVVDILPSLTGRNLIGQRTQSDRMADATRPDGGRNLIGWRTQTDWVADASGGTFPLQTTDM
jgi:hypothetical protein